LSCSFSITRLLYFILLYFTLFYFTLFLFYFILILFVQVIIKHELGGDITATTVNTFPFPLNSEFSTSFFPTPNNSFSFSSSPLSPFSASPSSLRSSYFRGSSPLDEAVGDFLDSVLDPRATVVSNFVDEFSKFTKPALRTRARNDDEIQQYDNTTDCLEFFFYTLPSTESDVAIIGNLPATNATTKSGFLGRIPQKSCWLVNESLVSVPYYELQSSPAAMQHDVYEILMHYNSLSLDDVDKPPYSYPLPDGTVEFQVSSFFIFLFFIFYFKIYILYFIFYIFIFFQC
jgi:hypothetical protein